MEIHGQSQVPYVTIEGKGDFPLTGFGNAKQTSQSQVTTPPVSMPLVRWWVVLDGQEHGPLDDATVYKSIRDGDISRDTECWCDGMDQWEPMGKLVEWADVFPPILKMPPFRKSVIQLPDFLEPVADAQYAKLDGLNAGSEEAQKRQKQWVEKGYPLEMIMQETGIVFRLLPPGEFQMGSSSSGLETDEDEKPYHNVSIASPLYMATFPVTQKQWRAIMDKDPARFHSRKDHPVGHVSWEDCKDFIDRIHVQLDLEFGKAIRLPCWDIGCALW